MAIQGYSAVVKAVGTAVPVVNEACALLSGVDPNERYQVTNTARRIWDPSAAIVVKDNAVTVNAADYTFDYLFGIVNFLVAATGPITVDGSYLPTVAVAEVRKYELKVAAALPDVTTFDSAGWRQFLQTLRRADLSLELLSSPLADLDAVAGGVQSLFSFLTADTPKVYEIARGAQFWRGWFRHEAIVDSAPDAEGVLMCQLSLKGSAQGALAALALGS